MRNEHLKALLPDTEALDFLATAATLLANARLAPETLAPLKLARMTALQKSGAQRRVRGIAVRDTFRRWVTKAVARQYANDFAKVCSPFQFGLVTPAGADCVAALLRADTDKDPNRVVIAVNGVGAYDHCKRMPHLVNVSLLLEYARNQSAAGTIDGLGNLSGTNVYLYRGTKDTCYRKGSVQHSQTFFESLGANV